MWKQKPAAPTRPNLSPHLEKVWGFVPINHLILATTDFVVFIDDALAVDWKTSPDWDRENPKEREKYSAILNRARALESDDWDDSDEQQTLNLRLRIGEAIARCFEGDYKNAEQMLDKAEAYRVSTRRKQAIQDHVKIRDDWRKYYRLWSVVHYAIGLAAVLCSTLVAARPTLLGFTENVVTLFAWLVAALTGILTLLTPDKKADKYMRAWSILNTQIIRYNSDEDYTLDDVLEAYHRGENIIFETNERTRAKQNR
ncbi:MAG: hypothetical protein WEA28_12560 [Xanthobacteraceae bacterium]